MNTIGAIPMCDAQSASTENFQSVGDVIRSLMPNPTWADVIDLVGRRRVKRTTTIRTRDGNKLHFWETNGQCVVLYERKLAENEQEANQDNYPLTKKIRQFIDCCIEQDVNDAVCRWQLLVGAAANEEVAHVGETAAAK